MSLHSNGHFPSRKRMISSNDHDERTSRPPTLIKAALFLSLVFGSSNFFFSLSETHPTFTVPSFWNDTPDLSSFASNSKAKVTPSHAKSKETSLFNLHTKKSDSSNANLRAEKYQQSEAVPLDDNLLGRSKREQLDEEKEQEQEPTVGGKTAEINVVRITPLRLGENTTTDTETVSSADSFTTTIDKTRIVSASGQDDSVDYVHHLDATSQKAEDELMQLAMEFEQQVKGNEKQATDLMKKEAQEELEDFFNLAPDVAKDLVMHED